MKRRRSAVSLSLVLLVLGPACGARADRGKVARELAELALRRFTKEAVKEGAEVLTRKIAMAAARHGDDVFKAVRVVGPRALRVAEEAGEHAPRAMRFLARHGDEAATILSHPRALSIFGRFGDDAGKAMLKHRGIAEPLIESYGTTAMHALNAVGPRNGRRFAMLSKSGDLSLIGHTSELLTVVGRYGDKAADFIWRQKTVLAGGAALAAFLANPEPYLDGTVQLVETVTEKAMLPVAQGITRSVGVVAEHAVKPTAYAAGEVVRKTLAAVGQILPFFIIGLVMTVGWTVMCGLYANPVVAVLAHLLGKLAAFWRRGPLLKRP